MTDGTGEILQSGSRDQEEVLFQEYELDTLGKERLAWGLFRDRRPECYRLIAGLKER